MDKNGLSRHSSKKSISYFTDVEGEGDPVLDLYRGHYMLPYISMLWEDVQKDIMSTYKFENSFKLSIEPVNHEVEKLILNAISERGYNLESAIRSFFEECAANIIAFGEAIYEMEYIHDENDKLIEFNLIHIPPITVIRKNGRVLQYIPEEVARKRNIDQYVELSPENIVIFKLPEDSNKLLSETRRNFIELSKLPSPSGFALKNIESNNSIPYDFNTHTNTLKLAEAEAGHPIGWSVRFSLDNEITEYYLLYLSLKFEKFIIELRNVILQKLNQVIKEVGEQNGFEARINIEGLPSLIDIENLQKQLESGEKSFIDIIKLKID